MHKLTWKRACVGRFQLLARWPGTHSLILSGIQRAAQTVLGVYLKRTCSRVTSASSALGVLSDYALYKSTHSLTHSCVQLLTSALNVALPAFATASRATAAPAVQQSIDANVSESSVMVQNTRLPKQHLTCTIKFQSLGWDRQTNGRV